MMAVSTHLIISNSIELIRVAADRIVYLLSDGNYTTLILTGGEEHIFTLNLGAMQRLIETQLDDEAQQFIRVGKSLIINRNYIYCIHIFKQQLILSDKLFVKKFELSASREALKQLKTIIEETLKK
jgi:DNA-binding LytR/AlgR family response regulator